MKTVKFRIDTCSISIYPGSNPKIHFLEVAEDFNEEISVKCTLEQLETLGKGILAYVAKEKP